MFTLMIGQNFNCSMQRACTGTMFRMFPDDSSPQNMKHETSQGDFMSTSDPIATAMITASATFWNRKKSTRTAASSSMGGRKVYSNMSAGLMPSQMARLLPILPIFTGKATACSAAPAGHNYILVVYQVIIEAGTGRGRIRKIAVY